jgi:dolichol-phosphate mannosyltransferase
MSLFVEEAYYWNYAQHLDFSYLDHPPMIAFLIKTSTFFFLNSEYSVRIGSFFCWFISAFFTYRLSELITKHSGIYSLLLLASFPFFFAQSILMTPDAPLMACWSASLYCLYRCLVLHEPKYWYATGIWIGLGMLSKYTIALLGVASLFYIVTTANARLWFFKKEPYLCVLISALLFTPVLYWNATHQWASFIFQSSRRFAAVSSFDLHNLIILTVLFVMPIGVWSLIKLSTHYPISLSSPYSKRFLQCFTLIPLGFFALFSFNHEINFNWIGPIFLALMPWLASLAHQNSSIRSFCLGTASILLVGYLFISLLFVFNKYEHLQQKLFIKLIDWESLIKHFNVLAQDVEQQTQKTPFFVALDNYPIASQLNFYQTKLMEQKKITNIYPVEGAHVFDHESLMYRYWTQNPNLDNKPLIIISKELWRFEDPLLTAKSKELSSLGFIWSQGQGVKNIPYYYKIVSMKTNY